MVHRRWFRNAEHTDQGISMQNWREAHNIQPDDTPRRIRAVAYYQHSAQDRQENSIPIQQDQVREWARSNGVEISQESADHGRSELTAEGRPAFTDLMENWIKVRHDFQYILCLDVSRCTIQPPATQRRALRFLDAVYTRHTEPFFENEFNCVRNVSAQNSGTLLIPPNSAYG